MMGLGLLMLATFSGLLDQATAWVRPAGDETRVVSAGRTSPTRPYHFDILVHSLPLPIAMAPSTEGTAEDERHRSIDAVPGPADRGGRGPGGAGNLEQDRATLAPRPLATLPMDLGGWTGKAEAIDPGHPRAIAGDRMPQPDLHQPEVPGVALIALGQLLAVRHEHAALARDLPAVAREHQDRVDDQVLAIPGPDGASVPVSRLAYGEGELVQGVGFLVLHLRRRPIERWVRGLPVTSRSSHGRTTRGLGADGRGLLDERGRPGFAGLPRLRRALLGGLDPIMPTDRAGYHVP